VHSAAKWGTLIDPNTHRIRMWQKWIGKGNQIFAGTWKLADPELTLDGNWQDVGAIALRLHRRKVR
jgi:hypothetical protein